MGGRGQGLLQDHLKGSEEENINPNLPKDGGLGTERESLGQDPVTEKGITDHVLETERLGEDHGL